MATKKKKQKKNGRTDRQTKKAQRTTTECNALRSCKVIESVGPSSFSILC